VSRSRRIGYIFVSVGIVLPLLLLFWTSGYDQTANPIDRILKLKVVFKSSVHAPNNDLQERQGVRSKTVQQRYITIPYRFPLALSVMMFFLGILAIDQSRTDFKAKK
jgi:hypothetical protein